MLVANLSRQPSRTTNRGDTVTSDRIPASAYRRPKSSATVEVFQTPLTGEAVVAILGRVHGFMTHWTGDRSELCYGDDCRGPIHKTKIQWKGYVMCTYTFSRTPTLATPAVYEITPRVWKSWDRVNQQGTLWVVQRSGVEGRKKECLATLHGNHNRPCDQHEDVVIEALKFRFNTDTLPAEIFPSNRDAPVLDCDDMSEFIKVKPGRAAGNGTPVPSRNGDSH